MSVSPWILTSHEGLFDLGCDFKQGQQADGHQSQYLPILMKFRLYRPKKGSIHLLNLLVLGSQPQSSPAAAHSFFEGPLPEAHESGLPILHLLAALIEASVPIRWRLDTRQLQKGPHN